MNNPSNFAELAVSASCLRRACGRTDDCHWITLMLRKTSKTWCFLRQVLHIWGLSVLRISKQSFSPPPLHADGESGEVSQPAELFWSCMQPVRVSGSSEIPDWFEKTLFIPSTHDRAGATSWIFLMERRESAAVGSLHLFFCSVFWFLNSCKSTTPHEETSDRWSVVFNISTSLWLCPPEHLRRVFGNIRL